MLSKQVWSSEPTLMKVLVEDEEDEEDDGEDLGQEGNHFQDLI